MLSKHLYAIFIQYADTWKTVLFWKIIFKNSQHDEIVQNDTLTICIKKSVFIEIKRLIFVFLNFINS